MGWKILQSFIACKSSLSPGTITFLGSDFHGLCRSTAPLLLNLSKSVESDPQGSWWIICLAPSRKGIFLVSKEELKNFKHSILMPWDWVLTKEWLKYWSALNKVNSCNMRKILFLFYALFSLASATAMSRGLYAAKKQGCCDGNALHAWEQSAELKLLSEADEKRWGDQEDQKAGSSHVTAQERSSAALSLQTTAVLQAICAGDNSGSGNSEKVTKKRRKKKKKKEKKGSGVRQFVEIVRAWKPFISELGIVNIKNWVL